MAIVNAWALHLLRGLGGAGSALAAYLLVALILPTVFLSLWLLPILLLYMPFGILVIGLTAVVIALTQRPVSPGVVAFWCGWAASAAVYLITLFAK
jgi:hypothetical protein